MHELIKVAVHLENRKALSPREKSLDLLYDSHRERSEYERNHKRQKLCKNIVHMTKLQKSTARSAMTIYSTYQCVLPC